MTILLILSVYCIITGLESYNNELNTYKNQYTNQSAIQEQINFLQNQIQKATINNAPLSQIKMFEYELEVLKNPQMPSILVIFNNMIFIFEFVGTALGIVIGFDLISKEKEERTLKSLLSHPIYRDAIINGKIIGAIAILSVALASVFIITIAIMLLSGIVPSIDDLIRITGYYLTTLLFCSLFCATAILISTITKNSSMSILITLGIIFLLFMISVFIPLLSNWLTTIIIGPIPSDISNNNDLIMINSSNSTDYNYHVNIEYNKYMAKKYQIIDTLLTISPLNDFQSIADALLQKQQRRYYMDESGPIPYLYNPSVIDSLLNVWTKIIALLIEIFIPLTLSYVAFMRMDVR